MPNTLSLSHFPHLTAPTRAKPLFQDFGLIVGPCAVESETQIYQIAQKLSERKLTFMRGGAFKPRTSPDDFQGLGLKGLQMMREAADHYKLKIVSEVMSETQVVKMAPFVDVIQIGTRNMYNYPLLQAVGKLDQPVLLKRGFSATVKEWLHAAEYIAAEGNTQIILCERGIRSFDPQTRNVLDLASAIWIKQQLGLQVIIDPSHATGIPDLVAPLTLSAFVSGLDGAMIEMSLAPDSALCDGHQAITLKQLDQLVLQLNLYKPVIEKSKSVKGS